MTRTMPRLRRLQRERGQVLVIFAILLGVIGGFAALAVDLGSYSADRRDLQNAADAIALAASLELPDAGATQDAADEWAEKNGVDPDAMTVTITQQSIPSQPNPKVRVELTQDHNFVFARLVGITSADVEAAATSIKTSAAGGPGAIPLSITEAALAGIAYGDEVVVKYDANNISQGNTNPIRIDSPGSGNCGGNDHYCSGVKFGSENTVCAAGADTTYCTGPSQVQTEPGNKVGPTRTAINYRLANTDTQCNDFTDVFEDDPLSSDPTVYRITAACNPFLAGGYLSDRVVIIPVIEQLCNGSCTVTITGFALAFLERIGTGGCTGNDCEVVARFVRVNQNLGLLAGTFDAQASNQFVRLTQ